MNKDNLKVLANALRDAANRMQTLYSDHELRWDRNNDVGIILNAADYLDEQSEKFDIYFK